MKIKQLQLQNYGRFEDLTVDFAPTDERKGNVTIIVGNNGAGKSQILQALATGLSWFVNLLLHENKTDKKTQIRMDDTSFTYDYEGDYISQKLIKNGFDRAYVSLNLFNPIISKDRNSLGITIDSSRSDNLNQFIRGIKDTGLDELVKHYQNLLKENDNASLPIISLYTINRNVEIESLHSSFNFVNKQIKGYTSCFNAGNDYSSFFHWFRDNEDLENEINKTKYSQEHDEFLRIEIKIEQLKEIQEHINDIDYFPNDEEKYKYSAKIARQIEDEEEKYNSLLIRNAFLKDTLNEVQILPLKFVRRAIEEFTEFKNIRIQRQGTPTMIVEKDGEELDVNQLSQGEKSLLALVGDIARRLAILNPSLDDPLQGEGVVMIDEVDLHLHPKWQHDLIDKLVRTFPNVQFILTTHSPLIVSDSPNILVYSLENGNLHKTKNIYGEDANTLLNNIFDVPVRTPEVENDFNNIRRAISNQEFEIADNLINSIAKKVASGNTELLKVKLLLAQAKLAQKSATNLG